MGEDRHGGGSVNLFWKFAYAQDQGIEEIERDADQHRRIFTDSVLASFLNPNLFTIAPSVGDDGTANESEERNEQERSPRLRSDRLSVHPPDPTLLFPPKADDEESIWDGPSNGNTKSSSSPSFIDDPTRDLDGTADDRPARFQAFQWSCKNLEKMLEKFSNSVQKLGSAIHLLQASRKLTEELRVLRSLLEENAEKLFPHVLGTSDRKKQPLPPQLSTILQEKVGNTLALTKTSKEDLRRLRLTHALDSLADTSEKFLSAMDDFPEFTNDDGRRNLLDFIGTVQNWSTALQIARKIEQTHEFRQLVHQLTLHLAECIDNMTSSLDVFMTVGIPCISSAQKRSFALLLNIATVATFLSGVTATTLQFTFAVNVNGVDIAVNTFWISSLVLSIAAAINSLLSLAWRQAVYSTPRSKVPWWVLIWFRQGCLGLLTASVMTFLCGLLLFVIGTQNIISLWVVTGVYVFAFVGLGSVTIWFAWERWDFHQLRKLHKRQHFQHFRRFREQQISWFDWAYYRARALLSRKINVLELPTHFHEKISRPEESSDRDNIPSQSVTGEEKDLTNMPRPKGWRVVINKVNPVQHPRFNREFVATSMWVESLPSLRNLKAVDKTHGHVYHMQFSPSGTWLVVCARRSCDIYRVNQDSFSKCQTLSHKTGHAKQAEWSPNGKLLLTMSRHGFKVWRMDTVGNFKCQKRIRCRAESEPKQILWIANQNQEFLTLAESSIFRMTIGGSEVAEYTLLSMGFNTRDSGLINFTLDTIQMSSNSHHSDRAFLIVNQGHTHQESELRSWKHVILFNFSSRKVNHLKISLDDIFGVSVSRDGRHILLAYSNKFPEVYEVEIQGKGLKFVHQCKSAPSMEVSTDRELSLGQSYFIGPSQNFIACTDAAGATHLWRRDNGTHIYTASDPNAIINISPGRSGPTVAVWNPQSSKPSFATALGSEGQVQLWYSTSDQQPQSKEVAQTTSIPSRGSSPALTSRQSWVDISRRRPRVDTRDDTSSEKRMSFSSNSMVSRVLRKAMPSHHTRGPGEQSKPSKLPMKSNASTIVSSTSVITEPDTAGYPPSRVISRDFASHQDGATSNDISLPDGFIPVSSDSLPYGLPPPHEALPAPIISRDFVPHLSRIADSSPPPLDDYMPALRDGRIILPPPHELPVQVSEPTNPSGIGRDHDSARSRPSLDTHTSSSIEELSRFGFATQSLPDVSILPPSPVESEKEWGGG